MTLPVIEEIRRRIQAQPDLSVRELERRASLGVGTLQKLLNGVSTEPSLPSLERVALALDTTLLELLGAPGDEGVGSPVTLLRADRLMADPANPRKHFDPDALAALANSIATEGLLQNLVVRPAALGFYTLLAGERRWRAIVQLIAAGRWPADQGIPCRIVEIDAAEAGAAARARALALIENLQRENLRPLEEAAAFRELNEAAEWPVQRIAAAIDKTDRYVQQRLALLKLMPAARAALDEERITVSQARALARANPSEQGELLGLIVDGALVTETEIDERAKYMARQNLPDPAAGKVQLDRPAAGSGGGAEPTEFMKDVAREHFAKQGAPEPYLEDDGEKDEEEEETRGPQPVPPTFYPERAYKMSAKVAALAKPAIEALLPDSAEAGDYLKLGHPDLLPVTLTVAARGHFGKEGGWEISAFVPTGTYGVGSGCFGQHRKEIEAFLAKGVELGLQVLEHYSRAAERAADQEKLAQTRTTIADVMALQLDSLSAVDCRLLAGAALEVVRANLRIAEARGWAAVDTATAAFDEEVEGLTDRVVRLAERQPAAAAPAPAPTATAPAPFPDLPAALDRRGEAHG